MQTIFIKSFITLAFTLSFFSIIHLQVNALDYPVKVGPPCKLNHENYQELNANRAHATADSDSDGIAVDMGSRGGVPTAYGVPKPFQTCVDDYARASIGGTVYVHIGQHVRDNFIRITRNDNLVVYNHHIQNPIVQTGDTVLPGQIISEIGYFEYGELEHIHFHVRFLTPEGIEERLTYPQGDIVENQWEFVPLGYIASQQEFAGDFAGDAKSDLVKVWNQGGDMYADVHVSSPDNTFLKQRFATKQGGIWDTMQWFKGDFAGDDKDDLVKIWDNSGSMKADVHISTPTGFTMQRFANNQGGMRPDMVWFVGDFAGDSKDDLAKIWAQEGDLFADVHISTPTGFEMQRFAHRQGGIWDGMRWFVGDFGGDEKADLVKIWDNNGYLKADAHISTPTGFVMERYANNQGLYNKNQTWFVGDFGGDDEGKDDLLKIWDNNGYMNAEAHFTSEANFVLRPMAISQGGMRAGMTWVSGDFAGDEKTDLAKVWGQNGELYADVHISDGMNLTMERFATKQGGIWDTMDWFVGDFSGNGKQDLAKVWGQNGELYSDVHISNGINFEKLRFATKQGGWWPTMIWLSKIPSLQKIK